MKNILYILLFISGSLLAQEPPNDSFSPTPGKYILSAWVKDVTTEQKAQYSGQVNVVCDYAGTGLDATFPMTAIGPVIDGWQRIISEFEVLSDIEILTIELLPAETGSYFDDVRVLPFNGNMKSFVYDKFNHRLMAELDENNYATFYEYDHEGGLVRVKKETERGVFTIQESRSKSSKATINEN